METEEKVASRSRKLLIASAVAPLVIFLSIWASHVMAKSSADQADAQMRRYLEPYEFETGPAFRLDLNSLREISVGAPYPTLLPSGKVRIRLEKPRKSVGEKERHAQAMLNLRIALLYRYIKDRSSRIHSDFSGVAYDLVETEHASARSLVADHVIDRLLKEDLDGATRSALVLTEDSWWTIASSGSVLDDGMGIHLWLLLQSPHWTDDKLKLLNDRLNEIWANPTRAQFFSTTRAAIRIEFTKSRANLRLLSSFWRDFTDGIFVHHGLIKRSFVNLQQGLIYRYWDSYAEEANKLSVLSTNVFLWRKGHEDSDLASACQSAQRWHVSSRLASLSSNHSSIFSSSTHVADIGPDFLSRAAALETLRRLTLTAIALKRFRLKNNRLPGTLEELVPHLMEALPVDLMDGKPLKYRPLGDTNYKLYSVGLGGVDAKGQMKLPAELYFDRIRWETSRFYTMWFSGADWVWPQRATDEEATAELKLLYESYIGR